MSESGSEEFVSMETAENSVNTEESQSIVEHSSDEVPTQQQIEVTTDNDIVSAQTIDSILPGDGLYDDDDDDEDIEIDQINEETEKFITCINPEIEAMGSTITDILLCPICTKQFCLEAGDPRDLQCGHTVCSKCLVALFSFSDLEVECPECKEKAKYRTIDAVPVSFTIKQIVETYLEKKSELENPKTTFNRKLTILEGTDETSVVGDAGTCKDHSLQIEFGCITCEQWLCATCVCLQHCGVTKSTCKVYPIRTALHNRKKAALAELDKKIETFEKMQSDGQGIDISINRLLEVMEKESKMLQSIIDRFKAKEDIYTKEKQVLKERSGKVSQTLSSLNSAKNPVQMKAALDFYFENKSFIHKETEKNDLFDTWRQSVSEVNQFWKENVAFYVKCPKLSESGWAKVTTNSNNRRIVVKFPDKNPETDIKNPVIMEVPFFDLPNHIYYAFIELDKVARSIGHFTFMVDDNPLGKSFLQRCCDSKNAFDDCIVKFITPEARVLIFGERPIKSPKKLVNIGDPSQYKKPFVRGAIGIIGKVENGDSIDVNNMIVYINLEETPPVNQKLSFMSNDEDNWFLTLCFGEVYDNIDTLFNIDQSLGERLTIIESGITVDAEEPSDSEE